MILKQKPNMVNYAKTSSAGVSGGAMRLTPDAINQIISELNSVSNSVDALVKSIGTESINKINSSWAAAEAKTYVDKVVIASSKINKVNDGLRLLSNAFNNTLKNVTSTGQNVSSDISRI